MRGIEMLVWNTSDPSIVEVQAAVTGGDTWTGQLFGIGGEAETAPDFNALRAKLAQRVWQKVGEGEISVPASKIERVRVFSHTRFSYDRQGEFSGPAVTIQAQADLIGGSWMAAADVPFPGVGTLVCKAEDFPTVREDLAATLLSALEVGIEGVPDTWSGLKLVVKTRKTFRVDDL
jgi:hypothetical protein